MTRRSLAAFAAAVATTMAGSRFTLRSPNGRIVVDLALHPGAPATYAVSFDGKPLLRPSQLGLRLGDGDIVAPVLAVAGISRTTVNRHYTLPVGKTREVRDRFNQLEVSFRGTRNLQLTFRAYDDGIAFRYRVPARHDGEVISLADELTCFDFAADYGCWGLNLGTFVSDHEGEFRFMRASAIGDSDLLDVPLVCRTATAAFAITEADLQDYAGAYLCGRGNGVAGVQIRLSPWPDEPAIAVRGHPGADLVSPWRVLMIARHPGELIPSTLVQSLNPPSVIEDTTWIRPGKYAWDWWSGGVVDGVEQTGMNNATITRYIDFAARNGLQYMMIDAGWYVSGEGGEGGPAADVTRSIAAIDLPALVAYGHERNIGLFVWIHYKALAPRMDEALALYQRLGLKGIKIDFLKRNDQAMVAFHRRLLETAAQHHLLVDLHGTCPPSGLSRTWPNLLTQEGVLGAEYNKWSARVTATHNVTLPFTRMLLGPMDYTQGGFRNVAPGEFVARSTLPMVQTTRGQALAMYVVYESPLVSLADTPDAYESQPGMEFLRRVPTSWDATRFIAGEIGEYVVIARQRGSDWFVGAMTNETARTIRVPLDFLGGGRFRATIHADGETPAALAITVRSVAPHDSLEIRLAASGGCAIALRRWT